MLGLSRPGGGLDHRAPTDLVALARPHLVDPMWTLRAAAQLDYRRVAVPPPYLGGMAQLARNLQREAELKA